MEIDWINISYLVVGLFALFGFFRGWWKEAFTSLALAILIILLQQPDWAQAVIDYLNQAIATGVQFASRIVTLPFSTDAVPQIEASQPTTWVIILFLLLGISAFLSRLALPETINSAPGKFYAVNPIGRVLGIGLGGVNGFLVLGLLREYLDGRALPGRPPPPETNISLAGESSFGAATQTVSIQAINLPTFTILDSYVPYLIIGLAILIFFAALWTRVKIDTSTKGAGRKIVYTPPYGYKPMDIKPLEKEKA